jgi:predicted phosphoribosyltransferase
MATFAGQRFRNRAEAGALLAERLRGYAGRDGVVVLGLPRGGVPVAFEIAAGLAAPLDVFLVRKLGVPGHREMALGAIATGGTRILNKDVIERLDIPPEWIEAIDAAERRELDRRELLYRPAGPPRNLAGKTGQDRDPRRRRARNGRDDARSRRCGPPGGPAANRRRRPRRRPRRVRAAA